MVTNQIYPRKAFINALVSATDPIHSTVTFTDDHDYTVGQVVSFRVTPNFGMFQINNRKGVVLDTTSDTITVDIDVSGWDAFDYSLLNTAGTSPPQCVPCCSAKVPASNPPRVNLLDSFDNRKV